MCEGGRPAFMRVVADVDRIKSYNKYLLRPLVGGELVKIDPNQNPSSDGFTADAFQRQFVRIRRKDDSGAWADTYVTTWGILEPLKKK